MKEIIYVSFWFSSHWCAGTLQITDKDITYWADGYYITEQKIKSDKVKSVGTVIKTKSGVIILINNNVEYFIKNNKIKMSIKYKTLSKN